MALQGLRGAGYNPVSGAPFQKMRDDREQKAVEILERKKERDDLKKEKEKQNKEADRKLQEEFDKAKQEAVILGLGKGKASSMSLGALKGWVSANRDLKVQQEKMAQLLLRKEEVAEKKKKAQREAVVAQQRDRGAEMAMRTPLRKGNKPGMYQQPKNFEELMGYNAAMEQRRMAQPFTAMKTPIQGGDGGMVTQTFGGGQGTKTQMPPQMPIPYKNEQGKIIGDVTTHGNLIPRNSGASSEYFQRNPAYDLVSKSSGQVVQPGANPGAMSVERYQDLEREFDKVRAELRQGPPKDMLSSKDKSDWTTRKRAELTELGDLLQRAKPTGNMQQMSQSPQKQQSRYEGEMSNPQQFKQRFVTDDNKMSKEFLQEITQAGEVSAIKQRKVELIRALITSGAIDEATGLKLLYEEPFAAGQ